LKVLPALKRKERESKKDDPQRERQEKTPEYENPWFVWLIDIATGTALGLFTAVEINMLTVGQIKEIDTADLFLILLYAVVGIGMIVSQKAGFYRAWRWAAERWAVKDWSAAVIASLIMLFIFAVEVSIVRAFRLSDTTILNPNDLGYWLSSCVFVLPCAFAASTKGWVHGIKPPIVSAPTSVATEDKSDPAQDAASTASPVVTPPVETECIVPEQNLSPDAFETLVIYAKDLVEEKKRLLEEKDRCAAPFQKFLKLREEELVFATELSEFTRRCLKTDERNASMNHEYAKAFILRLILAFERTTNIDVNTFIKVDARSVIVRDTAKKARFFWARLRERWTNFRKRRQQHKVSNSH